MRITRWLFVPAPLLLVLGLWALMPNAQPYFRGENLTPSTYTFADIPTASDCTGCVVRISDIGVNGSLWMSNGANWEPVGGQVVLCRGSSTITTPTDTSNNSIATCTIPAGLMGANSYIDTFAMWDRTSGTGNIYTRVEFDATGETEMCGTSSTNADRADSCRIYNKSSTESQINSWIGEEIGGSQNGNTKTTTLNTATTAGVIDFELNKTTGSDGFDLVGYHVTLVY